MSPTKVLAGGVLALGSIYLGSSFVKKQVCAPPSTSVQPVVCLPPDNSRQSMALLSVFHLPPLAVLGIHAILAPHKSVVCRLANHARTGKAAVSNRALKICATLCGVRGMLGSSKPLWHNSKKLHGGWHWIPLLTHLQLSSCMLKS